MSRQTTLPSPWREAADLVQGVDALCDALAAVLGERPDRRTIARWASRSRTPDPLKQRTIARWFARRELGDPWASAE